jgi:hypothetical protein
MIVGNRDWLQSRRERTITQLPVIILAPTPGRATSGDGTTVGQTGSDGDEV